MLTYGSELCKRDESGIGAEEVKVKRITGYRPLV